MTIDEAIKKYNKLANNEQTCYPEEAQQLAEWLEELKELRTTSCGYSKEDIELNRNAMYNKAIDDFVNLAKEHDFKHDKKDITNCVIGFIEFFAEQLKAGVKNEN